MEIITIILLFLLELLITYIFYFNKESYKKTFKKSSSIYTSTKDKLSDLAKLKYKSNTYTYEEIILSRKKIKNFLNTIEHFAIFNIIMILSNILIYFFNIEIIFNNQIIIFISIILLPLIYFYYNNDDPFILSSYPREKLKTPSEILVTFIYSLTALIPITFLYIYIICHGESIIIARSVAYFTTIVVNILLLYVKVTDQYFYKNILNLKILPYTFINIITIMIINYFYLFNIDRITIKEIFISIIFSIPYLLWFDITKKMRKIKEK